MPKPKSEAHTNNDMSNSLEKFAVDTALGMFRNMLLDEYTRRFDAGDSPDQINNVLAAKGIRFEILLKNAPKDTELLVDGVKKEIMYMKNNYYDIFASYRELSSVLTVLYTYSDVSSSTTYVRLAMKHLDALSKRVPDSFYDEQANLRNAAIDAMRHIVDGVFITRHRRKDDRELDTRKVLLNIASIEFERLEHEVEVLSGYIDTYVGILEKTLGELYLKSKKRTA